MEGLPPEGHGGLLGHSQPLEARSKAVTSHKQQYLRNNDLAQLAQEVVSRGRAAVGAVWAAGQGSAGAHR